MRTLLTSTSYFPSARYIAECLKADRIVIEACETYTKQSRRNHCEIAGPNGRQRLTVPVSKTQGNRTRTKDIRISCDLPWQNIHLRSITTAYNKSPFLLHYMDHFNGFFEKKYDFLIDLNTEILLVVMDLLGSRVPVAFSSDYERNPANVKDLRDVLVSKRPPPLHAPGSYTQPFMERYGFLENLSVLDLIFCLGPEARAYIQNCSV